MFLWKTMSLVVLIFMSPVKESCALERELGGLLRRPTLVRDVITSVGAMVDPGRVFRWTFGKSPLGYARRSPFMASPVFNEFPTWRKMLFPVQEGVELTAVVSEFDVSVGEHHEY